MDARAVIPAPQAMSITEICVDQTRSVAYATYDLTNQATLRVWSTQISVIDIAWGAGITALASTAGYLAAARLSTKAA